MENPNQKPTRVGDRVLMIPDGVAISEPREYFRNGVGGVQESVGYVRDVVVEAGPLRWKSVVIEPLVPLAIIHACALQSAQRKFDADLPKRPKSGGATKSGR
jgi:hypothetical protein